MPIISLDSVAIAGIVIASIIISVTILNRDVYKPCIYPSRGGKIKN